MDAYDKIHRLAEAGMKHGKRSVNALKKIFCLLMILCLAALAAQGYAPFVYFQF